MKNKFSKIWFAQMPSARDSRQIPYPEYLAATELFSGKTIETDRIEKFDPPFSLGDDSLIVTVDGSEVLGCFLSLEWPKPGNLIDIGVESRLHRNGLVKNDDCTLSAAMSYYNMASQGLNEFNESKPAEISQWRPICRSRIKAMISLFRRIEADIDLPRALFRGRYLFSVAIMERNGIPLGYQKFKSFRKNRMAIRRRLIDEVDAKYNVYEDYKFSKRLFSQYLFKNKIPWPKHESGELDLRQDAFKEMKMRYPRISELWNLRTLLIHLRENSISVGIDGRNRTPLVPFKSKTGRNQPSSTRHIFGNCVSLRSLIRPAPGNAIAYIDWSQQEYGIAAALSGDEMMKKGYESADTYIDFAILVGAAPSMATKQSHPEIREMFKKCILGTQYGMGEKSLAAWIGKPLVEARQLLQYHRQTFKRFWQWSDEVYDDIIFNNIYKTRLGWQIRLGANSEINERSLRNFPMQANGAEIMRVACVMATESGIKVCTPVHDALLIESSIEDIEENVRNTQHCMEAAGEIILDGFKLRTDCEIVRYPDHYVDPRGIDTWKKIVKIMAGF